MAFFQHRYSCKRFTGLSINTGLLNWPGLALWGRECLQKGMGVECGFWGKKQLFEDRKCFHGVGPVHLIMMTLDPITPESGSQHPCPAIKKQDSRL